MKDLMSLYHECIAELDSIGIEYGKIVNVKINTRAQKRLGVCKGYSPNPYSCWTHTIEISTRVLEDYVDDKVTKNVIIHEILHSCPNCRHHDSEWQKLAAKVNRELGYKIQRVYSPEEYGLKPLPKPERKYVIVCTKCGQEVKRAKRTKVITNPERYRCGRCGGTFERKS